MQFLHYEFNAGPSDVIRVTLDCQANVRLLDPINFARYRSGQRHQFYGGQALRSPVDLVPPHQGHWHVAIDMGGYRGSVTASVQLLE